MKSTKIILPSVLIAFLTIISSCKKEGCIDKNGTNYSSEAKKDDGTCKYEGRAVLWYGQTTSTELQNDGATSLTFYVDGQVVGSTSTDVYWTSGPECGQNGSITITKDLGNAKNKSYTYSVKDQDDFEYWSGVLNFTANTCEGTELTW
jgi:hypothetical protein